MTITLRKLPDEPIVLVEFLNPFSVQEDMPPFIEALRASFNASTEPLIDITDATGLKVSFGDMIAGMAMLAKGDMAVLRHPNAAGYFVVADSELIRLGASALNQGQYGKLAVTVVKTREEALARARESIQARAAS